MMERDRPKKQQKIDTLAYIWVLTLKLTSTTQWCDGVLERKSRTHRVVEALVQSDEAEGDGSVAVVDPEDQ